jgi:hypothetical protein
MKQKLHFERNRHTGIWYYYRMHSLRSIFWTLSIVPMFFSHNISRDGSSLVIRVGSPEDEGRAIPRNVVEKHRDDG